MGYAEQYQKAKDKGKLDQITTNIYKFTHEGETLVGEVVKIEPFTAGDWQVEVNAYILDTDIGRMSMVLGSATDKQLDKHKLIGKVIAITFHGQKELDGGKHVNLYTVEVL